MQTLALVTVFAMPAAIFLLAARALVVRLRLESHSLQVRATVTSYREWYDDMAHHDVTYRFVVGGDEYAGSGSASGRCQVGDPIDVIYDAERPAFNQLAAGGVATSPGLNVFVMLAMVGLEFWMASLLSH
jgi:hypothetical protein